MIPQYDVALADFTEGISAWHMWGRLGWQEIRRRYRRTVIGPFWTTLSLGVFILVLGVVWAKLWNQDTRTYLPFLCAGMLAWSLVSTIITEGGTAFTSGESLIKQLRFPYTILCCSLAWRNLIVFFHNLLIFVAIAVYAGVPINGASLLVVPGLALVWINAIWVATLLGRLCARYRDLQQLITSILQVALFVTPIFFTPDQLGPRFRRIVDWNLMFHYVDIVRSPLLGRTPAAWSWFMVGFATIFGWGITLWTYGRFRRRVPYWL